MEENKETVENTNVEETGKVDTQSTNKTEEAVKEFTQEQVNSMLKKEKQKLEKKYEGIDLAKDPLYYQLSWKADYSFHELVVFSPFLSSSVIDYWNKPEHSLTGTTRTLITRRSELPKLTADQVSRFHVYVLKDDIVDGEDYISADEAVEKQKQDIHKRLLIDCKWFQRRKSVAKHNGHGK